MSKTMTDPAGGGLDEIASVLFAAADRVRQGGPLELAITAGAIYIRELEAALATKQQYATVGQFFMDMIQGMLESGVNVDTPKNEVIDGYISGWTKQQRQIEELTAEVTKLREAIRRYGLTICQTSGDWTLHDLSPAAEQEAAKTAEVISENIDLSLKVRNMEAEIAWLTTKMAPPPIGMAALSAAPEFDQLLAALPRTSPVEVFQAVTAASSRMLVLATDVMQLTAEVQRLKAGKLSPDEFNALCHNLHETGQPLTPCEHEAACTAFRRQLYGTPAPSVADACHEHTSPD